MCALRHPRRDGPEPSAICRSRVRPHDATNVLVAVEHIVVVVSPCARRWRACCRGSWAIDDELGELRGIAGALAVVLHWPILDDFTSFSSAIRRRENIAKRRYLPEVGAVCEKSARTDLCGGRPVMDVPSLLGRVGVKRFQTAPSIRC